MTHWTPRAVIAAVAALLLLAGCSALTIEPPPQPADAAAALGGTVDVPAEWTAGAAATRGSDATLADPWWATFGDPRLSSLIEEGLAGSFDLAAAAARVGAAEARARIAGAALAPRLDVGLDGARTRRNFIGFPIPGSDRGVLTSLNTTWGVSLNLSWEADLWGRLRSGRSAVRSDLGAARADLAGAALSLSGQTAKAYFAVLEAREQTALAKATLDNRRSSAERVLRRYETGLRTALDLRLARAEVASAESVLEARRQALDALERQLQVLVGRYPDRRFQGPDREDGTGDGMAGPNGDGPDALPDTLPAYFADGPEPVPAGLPAEIVARRPDLAAAEERLAAAGFRVAEARAALYPGLRLTGSAGRSSEQIEDLLDGDFSVWSIAGGLLQPLFHGGQLRANVDLSRASFDEATALYAGSVLRAFREVETTLAAEGFLADRAAALARAAEESRRAQKLAEERYLAGLTDFLSVLESQRRSFDADSQLLQVTRQRLDARVDLVLALGGGYRAGAPGDLEEDPAEAEPMTTSDPTSIHRGLS